MTDEYKASFRDELVAYIDASAIDSLVAVRRLRGKIDTTVLMDEVAFFHLIDDGAEPEDGQP